VTDKRKYPRLTTKTAISITITISISTNISQYFQKVKFKL